MKLVSVISKKDNEVSYGIVPIGLRKCLKAFIYTNPV